MLKKKCGKPLAVMYPEVSWADWCNTMYHDVSHILTIALKSYYQELRNIFGEIFEP